MSKPRPIRTVLGEKVRHRTLERLAGFLGRLEAIRELRGLSYVQLAKSSGVDLTSLSRIRNHGAVPYAQTVVALADALGCSTDYLLGLTESASGVATAPDGLVSDPLGPDADVPSAPVIKLVPPEPGVALRLDDAGVAALGHALDLLAKGRSTAHLAAEYPAELEAMQAEISRARLGMAKRPDEKRGRPRKRKESAAPTMAHAATASTPLDDTAERLTGVGAAGPERAVT